MLEKYNHLCDVCGIDKPFNQTAVQTLFDVFSTIGVQSDVFKEEDGDESEICKIEDKKVKPKLYVLPFFSAVRKDFSGRGRVRHAIILIGAGRRGLINYYHFLNSWGKKFCLRILRRRIRVGRTRFWSPLRTRNTEKALGGFGLLRASDIRARPVTFLRHEDDYEYYKKLLLKDIVPRGKKKEGPEEASIIPLWGAPQHSNTCSGLRKLICQKMEGTSPIDSPDQVLVSNEPQHQSDQVVHAICSHGDEMKSLLPPPLLC
ncbi:unnamed protein product [Urochloa humidicola]